MADDQLQILIDVRSRLDEVVKAQREFKKLGEEANSTSKALGMGAGMELARRGLDMLVGTTREYIDKAFEMAVQVKEGSRNLEMSTDAYQVLANVIRSCGGDMQMFTMATTTMNRSLVEARSLSSGAAGAYRILGLSVAALEQMPVEKRFEAIGQAVLNSKDRTEAFAAASHVLGSRNIPILLEALKKLASDGFEPLSAAQKAAGQIMDEATITRLEEAHKQIERLKNSITIGVGGSLGWLYELKDAFGKDKLGTIGDVINSLTGPAGFSALAARLAANRVQLKSEDPKKSPADSGKQIALAQALAEAEYNLAAAQQHRQTIESNPNQTDYQKKARLLELMQEEVDLRQKLIAAINATPVDNLHGETQQARDLKIKKLQEENDRLQDELQHRRNQNNQSDKDYASSDKFNKFMDDGGIGRLNPKGAAAQAGQDWVSNLGTSGEQVANALRSTIGNTVSGISDGIYGWITGTKSFGQSIAQLGGTIFKTFLDTVIQIGVQWLVTQALIKMGMISTHVVGEGLRAQRMAGTAAEGAESATAMAPAAAASSVASFGAADVLGVLGVIAALAAITALFGGFREAGGDVQAGRPYIVGERRAEVFVPNQSGKILPNIGALGMPGRRGVGSVGGSVPNYGGGTGAGGRDSARNINILMNQREYARMMQEQSADWFRELHASEMRKYS